MPDGSLSLAVVFEQELGRRAGDHEEKQQLDGDWGYVLLAARAAVHAGKATKAEGETSEQPMAAWEKELLENQAPAEAAKAE